MGEEELVTHVATYTDFPSLIETEKMYVGFEFAEKLFKIYELVQKERYGPYISDIELWRSESKDIFFLYIYFPKDKCRIRLETTRSWVEKEGKDYQPN